MPNIDIEVDADLKDAFQIPTCVDLGLPNAGELKLRLPTGGTFRAFADISKGIPTDCSLTFSLMLQLAPFLAAIECPLKILKLLKPLIEIVNSLPGIPPVKAIKEFGEAAADLTESCILKIAVPELAIIPFIQDLLCLILKVLRCFRSQMIAPQHHGAAGFAITDGAGRWQRRTGGDNPVCAEERGDTSVATDELLGAGGSAAGLGGPAVWHRGSAADPTAVVGERY
jgi:hypothetical protein